VANAPAHPVSVGEQWEDMEKQAHAARFGMWVFLGTEVLFFSGLFALYTAYRIEHPGGFDVGVDRRVPRRNAEAHCTSWSLGGREEDRLLRLLAGRSKPTASAIEHGVRLADELVLGDEDRAAAAIQFSEAALTATGAMS
jgi:hypothetical protein